MKTTISLKRGFTLVEIMIVVAIIGLLSAVAIPKLNKARKKTQKTACHENLRKIDGMKTGLFAIKERKEGHEEVSLQDLEPYLDGDKSCPGGVNTHWEQWMKRQRATYLVKLQKKKKVGVATIRLPIPSKRANRVGTSLRSMA